MFNEVFIFRNYNMKEKTYSLYENLIMRTYMGRNVMKNEHCACRKKGKSGLPRKCKDYQEKQDCQGDVRTTRKIRTAMEM